MKQITIVTSNKHKVEEMSLVLRDYGIELVQNSVEEYIEDKDKSMKEIAESGARYLANKLGKEAMVEDTGLYFEAYDNFPGAQPKFVFKGIGFRGIFRLLYGRDRSAYFKTVIGYCKPGEEPVTFEGVMKGKILDEIIDSEKDAMPYDHIFQPEGQIKAIVEMTLEEKNKISQRGEATRKLGEYLSNN